MRKARAGYVEATARREFTEELGSAPMGALHPLGAGETFNPDDVGGDIGSVFAQAFRRQHG